MKTRATVLLLGLLLAAAAAPARAAGYIVYTEPVTMSDGVSLEASLYVPGGASAENPVPLIVRQHGGGSNKDNTDDQPYGLKAVETGKFALLMYSHRGHGNSEGIWDFFGPRTTKDFSEMLDWVAAGWPKVDTNNVGVSGYSQGGGESLLPAEFDARVKAVAAGNTFASLDHALNPGDCFKASFATGIFALAYTASASRSDDALALRWGATLYTDTEDVPLGVLPSTTEDLRSRSPVTYLQSLIDRKVPVFWTQSWEDQLFPGDHPEMILGPLQAAGVPVHYWFASGGHANEPNFAADEAGKEAAILAWFEQFLLGEDHGFTTGPKVDYWQRTAPGRPGDWVHKTADAWPLPEATPLPLYPRADGSLGDAPDSGGSVGLIVNDVASANVANDPILAGQAGGMAPGIGDVVRAVPEGANPLDTIRFARALNSDMEVTGAPVVETQFSTSALRVLQIDAKVWDVAPDGSAMLVNKGCSSFDPSSGNATVRLWPNSHVFPAGHSLVLTLSSTDFPTFKPDTEPVVTDILAGTMLTLPVTS
ncbi:MAG: CocE/NonD family hydrolase [Acidobacteria bacterium]|nr:CocE/NonD family hydrolase [Acidobacteriota bacterium]